MSNGNDPKYELVSTTQRTRRAAITYVSPDPDAATRVDLGLNEVINTLVIRPEYRLELGLGNIDALFPTAVDNNSATMGAINTGGAWAGRKARLQVAGLFYRPLNNAKAHRCYEVVWDHFLNKRHLERAPRDTHAWTDAQGNQALRDMVQNHVVEGDHPGKLPRPGTFAKIRLPGGYAFSSLYNTEPGYEADFAFTADLFNAEEKYYAANPVLGRIPIVARVMKKAGRDHWVPAPGVKVYFQLIKPDAPLARNVERHALRDSTRLPRAEAQAASAAAPPPPPPPPPPAAPWPRSNAGPNRYVGLRRETYHIDQSNPAAARDPQVFNAHVNLGGKREMMVGGARAVHGKASVTTGSGAAVDRDNVFCTEAFAGFNSKHADNRDLGHKDYPQAQEVPATDTRRRNCVKASTNEDGEAGVIFMPSRVSGDRYRLRAFIGPDTLDSDGTEDDAIHVETGTLVVWRTIRLSRYLKHECPSRAAQISATLVNETVAFTGGATNANAARNFFVGRRRGGSGNLDFNWMKNEYAKAYCEFIVEHGAAQPVDLSTIQAEWQAAYNAAIAAATADNHTINHHYDCANLFYFDMQTPYTFNVHTPTVYNASGVAAPNVVMGLVAPANIAADETARRRLMNIMNHYMKPAFLGHLSKDGMLPGLTVLRGPQGCTWDDFNLKPTIGGNLISFATSGEAREVRAPYVWYGIDIYNGPTFIYPLSSNTVHEMGHCLYREHAPGGGAGGAQPDHHDSLDICVMSYRKCEGQYCGTCVGTLMGFDTRAAQFKTPT